MRSRESWATSLASVVRGSEHDADGEVGEDDSSPFLDKAPETEDSADDNVVDPDGEQSPPPKKKPKPKKEDPADWWKRGERPPF